MPQVDVQWPSEDENSDESSNKEDIKTTTTETDADPAVAENAEEANHEDNSDEQKSDESAQPEPETESFSEESENHEDSDNDNNSTTIKSRNATVTEPNKVTNQSPKGRKVKMDKAMFRIVGEAVLVLAVIGLGLWSWSLYNDRKDLQTQVATLNVNPQVTAQKQTEILIHQVSKLMQLPTGETPTVVEVTNVAQARKQSAFFTNAQDGDKVLLYVKAGEAILYRPSTNKIILVAPITYNGASNTSTIK